MRVKIERLSVTPISLYYRWFKRRSLEGVNLTEPNVYEWVIRIAVDSDRMGRLIRLCVSLSFGLVLRRLEKGNSRFRGFETYVKQNIPNIFLMLLRQMKATRM